MCSLVRILWCLVLVVAPACAAGPQLIASAARPADGAKAARLDDLASAKLAWQAQEGAGIEVAQDRSGAVTCSMRFSRPGSPVWTAHLATEDWSGQGTLLLDFAPGDASPLVVGIKDIYGTAAACPVDVPVAGGIVRVPLAHLYLQGVMLRYVKSVAFWIAPGAASARSVNLKGMNLSAAGFSADWPRAKMAFLDPSIPSAPVWFGSAKRWVSVSDEHAGARGKKSFLCAVPNGKWLNTFGLVQHDWRNFTALAFDLHWPADKPSTMRFIIRDCWIKGTGNNVEAAANVAVKPGDNAILIPFSQFKTQARFDAKTSTTAPTLPIAWEFVHQIGWQPQADEPTNTFSLANIRLEGGGRLAPELVEARKSMPAWGYDRLARVDIPGSFDRVDIPSPGDKPSLEVGVAKAKITCALGTPMSEERKVSGVLDDLYVRAAVLKDGERQVLLLTCETLYFPAIPEITSGCSEATGIAKSNIYYCATHNHNAGAPYASKEFTKQIIDAAVQAAKVAKTSLQPVRVGVAVTTLDVNYNRNQRLPGDGQRFYTVLDHRFLEKSMDSMPACKDLSTVLFTTPDGRVVASIVTYSAHANMLCRVSDQASADWPGWTSRLVEAETGGICLTIPVAFGSTNMKEFNIDYSSTIKAGRDVAAAALRSVRDSSRLTGMDAKGTLGIYTTTAVGSPAPGKDEPRVLPVRVLRFGAVSFVDPGGELFTEFDIATRKRTAAPYTFFTFSTGGYFPTPEVLKASAYGSQGRKDDWGQAVSDAALTLIQGIREGTTRPSDAPGAP